MTVDGRQYAEFVDDEAIDDFNIQASGFQDSGESQELTNGLLTGFLS